MGRQKVAMSRAAADAVVILGAHVRMARHDNRWTRAELAARAQVSARTVAAVESGSGSTSIGNVFTVAVAAGITLFAADDARSLAVMRGLEQGRVALLPSRVRHQERLGDDGLDF